MVSSRFKCCLLFAGVLIVAGSAPSLAALETWKGFDWEDQPLAGYTGGDVSVDAGTDQLFVRSNGGSKSTSFLPYPANPGERFGLAKFIWPAANAGQELVGLHIRVYDPGSAAGWAVVLKNSAGKIVDFGIRPMVSGNGKLAGKLYDGATWNGNGYIGDRYKSGAEYWEMTFTKLAGGEIKVDTDWVNAVSGATANYSWTTPAAFGAIEDVFLTASTSGTTYTTFKYIVFEPTFVPEPSSLAVLAAGLSSAGWMLFRRR